MIETKLLLLLASLIHDQKLNMEGKTTKVGNPSYLDEQTDAW